MGAYAEVFRVDEWVHNDAGMLARTPLTRCIVAKVFRDSAPSDWEAVYASELQTLLALGANDRLVGLRGAVDRMPPTFVCGHSDCGKAFQVERCPQCSSPLHNHDSNETLLICEQGHRFQKYNTENARSLTVRRPCAHVDDCVCVNFLFRPYIFLEQLDFDLRALNEFLAASPQAPVLEQTLAFDSKPETDDRRREVLLLRLNVLLGIAEGILFMHDRGCLHADIAPENTMVRMTPSSDGKTLSAASASGKLIDFGLAKRLEDNRTSTTVVGRITFLAPEQMVAQGTLGPKVSIRFRDGIAREGELCRISMLTGDELPFERRDFVRDVEDGQYEILDENDVSPELDTLLSISGTRQEVPREAGPSMYARILKAPATGRDAEQTTLRFSYALDIPTDIFSLGCLIVWTVTAGQENLVHLVREQANVATRRRQVLTGDFAARLLGEDYRKFCNAIDLPKSDQDDAIRTSLLDVMCRCLIRSEGGYCRQRSSGYNRPAASIVADLRRIRNALFFLFSAPGDVANISQRQIAEEANRLGALKERLEQLELEAERACSEAREKEAELRARNEERISESRRMLGWRVTSGAMALGCVVALVASIRSAEATVIHCTPATEKTAATADVTSTSSSVQMPENDPGSADDTQVLATSLKPIDSGGVGTATPTVKPSPKVERERPVKPNKVMLSNLVGASLDEAKQHLKQLGLKVIVVGSGSKVIEQSASGLVSPGSTISIKTSDEKAQAPAQAVPPGELDSPFMPIPKKIRTARVNYSVHDVRVEHPYFAAARPRSSSRQTAQQDQPSGRGLSTRYPPASPAFALPCGPPHAPGPRPRPARHRPPAPLCRPRRPPQRGPPRRPPGPRRV